MNAYSHSSAYAEMVDEFAYIAEYKSKWASAPFKPVFVTVDAVVICSGHVLVVTRKHTPGKGLYALPGGFIGNELIVDAALRELCEETHILNYGLNQLNGKLLAASIVDQHVFDHPNRSARGRTITHAFCFNLGDGPLPIVYGGDDAATAQWMPLCDVQAKSAQFFEDHTHIITHFAAKF
jgi:bifunctional NMN adenylyltransferase/nudix hydrolase